MVKVRYIEHPVPAPEQTNALDPVNPLPPLPSPTPTATNEQVKQKAQAEGRKQANKASKANPAVGRKPRSLVI